VRTPLLDSLRRWLPASVRRRLRDLLPRGTPAASLAALSPADAFGTIYGEGMWGSSINGNERYCSGIGSRDAAIVEPYVAEVRSWLGLFPAPPAVVDLGCGDFHVGSLVRGACGRYVACDCVPALIEHNRSRWAHLDVDFRVHDATSAPTPEADVVFIRQVLQHLSNELVEKVLRGIEGRYQWAVVTEHVPAGDFPPNVDKPLGPDVRLSVGSGVVVTEPPFGLRPLDSQVICDIDFEGSRITTVAYRLR
jgi:hypothetical protein